MNKAFKEALSSVNRAHFQQKPLRKSANLGKIRWVFLFCAWSRSFMPTLQEILERNVREAAPELYEKLDRNRVRCYSCGHCCPIADGQVGVCKVRFHRGGTLYVPWGLCRIVVRRYKTTQRDLWNRLNVRGRLVYRCAANVGIKRQGAYEAGAVSRQARNSL